MSNVRLRRVIEEVMIRLSVIGLVGALIVAHLLVRMINPVGNVKRR